LLRARHIITGSCLPAGGDAPAPGGLALSLALWDVANGALVKTYALTAPDFAAVIAASRAPVSPVLLARELEREISLSKNSSSSSLRTIFFPGVLWPICT
jgi:hypothetical protein